MRVKRKCELCSNQAAIYCGSDQASLCCECDSKVHGANFLVAKHSRTLLCHVCQSPTPWTGSGPKLGPTFSVCQTCLSDNKEVRHRGINDDDHDRDHDDDDGDDNGDEDDDDNNEDDDGDDEEDEDEDEDEDDEDNQVVPWSYSVSHPRKLAAHAHQKKQQKDEEEEKLSLQKARELEEFDQQNHGAVPHHSDKNYGRDKNGFHGANSVKVTSYEEEALRTMKAFWLPSATPEAPAKVDAPSTCTTCPEGKEKLKLKSLFPIHFTEESAVDNKSNPFDKKYICPSCKVTLTNAMSLVALNSCGHVFCKKCADKFMAVDKVCLVCDKPCKEKNLVGLAKGGTGFAGHDDHLEATDFKHLGSGSGLGPVRPSMKV